MQREFIFKLHRASSEHQARDKHEGERGAAGFGHENHPTNKDHRSLASRTMKQASFASSMVHGGGKRHRLDEVFGGFR